jgi:hypothetical protein
MVRHRGIVLRPAIGLRRRRTIVAHRRRLWTIWRRRRRRLVHRRPIRLWTIRFWAIAIRRGAVRLRPIRLRATVRSRLIRLRPIVIQLGTVRLGAIVRLRGRWAIRSHRRLSGLIRFARIGRIHGRAIRLVRFRAGCRRPAWTSRRCGIRIWTLVRGWSVCSRRSRTSRLSRSYRRRSCRSSRRSSPYGHRSLSGSESPKFRPRDGYSGVPV